ncbi:hypothetical protein [Variovorax ureilyticus]|uniref:hypothetical protein n=1 Tax=Variovorax ureilyticus TaxID=1836198 RepID=UPI003BF5CF34
MTTSEDWQTGKGIHYRMSPDNLPCLTRAVIGCCVLANTTSWIGGLPRWNRRSRPCTRPARARSVPGTMRRRRQRRRPLR